MDASHNTDTVSVGDTAHGSARATVAEAATPMEADQEGVEAEQPEGSGSPTRLKQLDKLIAKRDKTNDMALLKCETERGDSCTARGVERANTVRTR